MPLAWGWGVQAMSLMSSGDLRRLCWCSRRYWLITITSQSLVMNSGVVGMKSVSIPELWSREVRVCRRALPAYYSPPRPSAGDSSGVPTAPSTTV